MHTLWLVIFLVFFGIVGPAFLYWASRFIRTMSREKLSFIGFPEDKPGDHPGAAIDPRPADPGASPRDPP
jgi:hypothetical protein